MLEWRVKSAKIGKSEFHSLSLHVSVDDHVDCMFRRKGKKKCHKTTLICLKVYVSLFNSCVKLCVCIYIYIHRTVLDMMVILKRFIVRYMYVFIILTKI